MADLNYLLNVNTDLFASRAIAAGYLGALIDGEGSIANYAKKHSNRRAIQIYNTDLDILSACASACAKLGIRYHLYSKKTKRKYRPCWMLKISDRDSFEIVSKEVPIFAKRKKENLYGILACYLTRKPDKIYLEQLYIAEHKSTVCIGKELNKPACTVNRWLAEYKIPRRTFSQAAKIQHGKEI